MTHIDFDRLAAQARHSGLIIHVAAIPGTLVHKGRPLLHVVGGDEDGRDRELAQAFMIERHRDFDHDPQLGLIALGEIAGRALAPATNDPGTAIEVLNAILRTLNELPVKEVVSDGDLPSIHVPRPSVEDLVRAGFQPIIREGSGEEEVAIRTFKVLAALGDAFPHAREITRALSSELEQNVQREMRDKAAIARTLATLVT